MARLFRKGRSDGYLVEDKEPMHSIMPYLMRGRNESAVYFKYSVEIDDIRDYIRAQRRAGKRITLMNIMVAAILHVLYQRPGLNRFIAGRRLYQHKVTDVSYTVKKSLTDVSPESVAKVVFENTDNLFTVTEKMNLHIDKIREEDDDTINDDLTNFMKRLSNWPRWILRSIASILRVMDFHGILPVKFQQLVPMYSSVFVSHLGSLGAEAPFHHLYEFGTTSIFMTIGKAYDKPVKTYEDKLEWRKCVDLMFSVDERICDGYYLVRSLRLLEELLGNLELLELSPVELERKMTEEKLIKKARRQERNNRKRKLMEQKEAEAREEASAENSDLDDIKDNYDEILVEDFS